MICYDFQLINLIMFCGSLAITLFSVLSAKEQADRLKNSGFGALASSVISILITMLEKDKSDGTNVYLIAYTFAGCALGALIGWLVILWIVNDATKRKQKNSLVKIELLYTGLSGVKTEINRRERQNILEFLKEWNSDFENTLCKEMTTEGDNYSTNIYTWLKINCDLYRIALKTFGKNINDYSIEDYQSRASLIIFGRNINESNSIIEGYHWISYEGVRPKFKRNTVFGVEHDAYKVITQEQPSIFKHDPNNDKSPKRAINNNEGDYKTYLLFRVNDFCVLTIDWQSKIKDDDDIFDVLKSLFQKSICPKISEILEGKEVEILKTKNLIPLLTE